MAKTYKQYSVDFKLQAIRLADATDRPMADVAVAAYLDFRESKGR